MTNERRAYQRYPVELEVKLRKFDITAPEIDAKVVDVSFGGLAIIASVELQLGTEINIEWVNPKFYYQGEPVSIAAIVNLVELEGEGGQVRLGVLFLDTDSKLIESLLNWIHTQAGIQKRAAAAAKKKKRINY